MRVYAQLETDDQQHSRICTTVCLKAISVIQQGASQGYFLFSRFCQEVILSFCLSVDINPKADS